MTMHLGSLYFIRFSTHKHKGFRLLALALFRQQHKNKGDLFLIIL